LFRLLILQISAKIPEIMSSMWPSTHLSDKIPD